MNTLTCEYATPDTSVQFPLVIRSSVVYTQHLRLCWIYSMQCTIITWYWRNSSIIQSALHLSSRFCSTLSTTGGVNSHVQPVITPMNYYTIGTRIPRRFIWRNLFLLLLMWSHDQSKRLRALSSANVVHFYHICSARTRTKHPKLLWRHFGILRVNTITRINYMRCQQGDQFRGCSVVCDFSCFSVIVNCCTVYKQKENFDDYKGTYYWHLVINKTCAHHAHYVNYT